MKEKNTIADRLRTARKSVGMTQLEAANAAGITLQSYQRYEGGQRGSPRVDILMRLAVAFEVSLDHLAGMPEKE